MERQPHNTIELSHMIRYYFASSHVKDGDKVLDVFCGTGYGSKILLNTKASSITGFDKNKELPKVNGIKFIQAEYPKIEFPDDSFDFITLFEGIEHIEHELVMDLLDDIIYWLKPGGQLFISTPNQQVVPYNKEKFPYHTKHYSPGELESLLTSFGFKVTNWWNQKSKVEPMIKEGHDGRYMIVRCV